MRIIINADDLGFNPVVNNAIDQALSMRFITSSTILANTLYWDDVVRIYKKYPSASFGVHLNLTQGVSLTKNPILRKFNLIDDNGFFLRGIHNMHVTDKELLNAIYEEWDAQISLVKSHGINISHLDGHHHVHALDDLQDVLISLKNKYGIRCNRNKYTSPLWLSRYFKRVFNTYREDKKSSYISVKGVAMSNSKDQYSPSYLFKLKQYITNILKSSKWRRIIKKNNGVMPEYFDAYETMCKNLSQGLTLPTKCVVELMCHPGSLLYTTEMEMVKNKQIENYLSGYKYISYRDI